MQARTGRNERFEMRVFALEGTTRVDSVLHGRDIDIACSYRHIKGILAIFELVKGVCVG